MSADRRIPTTVISGFLGVGKTTAIVDLSQRKPADKRWAVIVNEFGQVGIDGALLSGALEVRELPGGCLCCAGDLPFRVMLDRVLTELQPDRLLIEPTGLADLGRLVETLRSESFAERLVLNAVITLVDPRHVLDPRMEIHRTWQGQIQAADILVANRCDVADEAAIRAFVEHAEALFPPKRVVATTAGGQLDPAWLDLPAEHRASTGVHRHLAQSSWVDDAAVIPERVSRRLRRSWSGPDHATCGWVFGPDILFDRARLNNVVQDLMDERGLVDGGAMRVKGLFHTHDGWMSLQASIDGTRWDAATWRRDSRLEVIATPGTDWDAVEERLMGATTSAGAR